MTARITSRRLVHALLFAATTSLTAVTLAGQAPPAKPAAEPAAANMLQLMRGMLFPNSNVIFAVQDDDPAAIKPAADPSTSPNPLASAYGGWLAVENSALALAESATLLTLPRACANGRPAPVSNADWVRFTRDLREAGVAAYQAAQARSQERMVEAGDVVTTACASCHDVYREKTAAQGGDKSRCVP
jgi:hypothetical protein